MTVAPSPSRLGAGRIPQLAQFRQLCEVVAGEDLSGAPALHEWSIAHFREFWRTFLDWSGLVWEGRAEPVCTSNDVRTARFFPEVRLNYAENVLRPIEGAGDDAPALTSVHADGSVERFTRGELREAVCRAGAALARLGLVTGDRVVAIAPNHAEVAVAALAVAALGATLSTATPDMGPSTLLGRFDPVRPVAALVDRGGLAREGRTADEVLDELLAGLPTVRLVVTLDDLPLPERAGTQVVRLADAVSALPPDAPLPSWPRLPVDHPLWVMFSSGTTGAPKAMVHGAGGSLLEHIKEHRLHGDLRPGDTLYFHTTTAWMMWNWQLSALAVGAHVVVYDGPITGPETLWRLVAEQGVTVFGTSPAYLQMCQDEGYRPKDDVDLSTLRAVMSTGAVLHEWQFDWVADAVGSVPLQSISGGTDIVGCFVLGHPEQPVRPGRAQSLSLGLDVAALDDEGRPVLGEVGELVCRSPFPSRPVHFLADPDGARFTHAYFAEHAGVWTHGDRIEIAADGSSRLHGRSDGVLNVNGIRIGPSEIYTIVRRIPGVVDAMAVEQADPTRPGESRLVLLVILADGVELDDPLTRRIRTTLRREGSAAHVPSLVLAVPEVPLTHNGKRSESAARAVLDGQPVRNLAALRNPGCLDDIAAALREATALPGLDAMAGTSDEAVVRRAFHSVLGFTVTDPDADFADLGGTSRQLMTLLRLLRSETGRWISLEAFLADPTISGATAALAAGDGGSSTVEVLRPGDDAVPPLYLLHGAFGDVDSYRYLLAHLDARGPVYGLVGRMHDADGRHLSVEEIASAHVRTLTGHRPEGTLRLAGYSFGGLVAFEMAQQLTAAGREVEFLGLLDVRPPAAVLNRFELMVKRGSSFVARWFPGMASVDPWWWRTLRPSPDRAVAGMDDPTAESTAVYEAYRAAAYPGAVTFFRVRRRVPVVAHLMYTWRRRACSLAVVDVPGAHFDMLSEKNAPVLAAAVSSALAGASSA